MAVKTGKTPAKSVQATHASPRPRRPAAAKSAPRRAASRSSSRIAPARPAPRAAKRPSPLARISSLLGKIRPPTGDRRPMTADRRRLTDDGRRSPVVRQPGLSLDRKLDLIGVVLVFIGLPTLLSLFSVNRSAPTGGWVAFLGRTFGWGAYLFPVTLIAIGLWLILRNFERIPQASLERIFGLLVLFFNLLAGLHFVTLPETRQVSYELAEAAWGGGYIGAALFELLRGNLGMGGAAIALLAWLVIALTLTLDVAVTQLFQWAPRMIVRVQDFWDDLRTRNGNGKPAAALFPVGQTPPVGRGNAAGGVAAPGGSATPVSAGAHPAMPETPPKAWILPTLEAILEKGIESLHDDESDRRRAHVIEETLASFGAPVNVVEVNRGPTITQFGVEPDFLETRSGRTRVRVGKIASLADDLALALSARTIRVQAPVPGKGYVGIEVPNEEIALVALRDVIESEAFTRLKSALRFAIGEDVAGNAVAADLAAMPHLLIAGATGSGKSVCVNAVICCLLLNNTPDELRLIMVDPKRVELTGYNGIPHLLAPVVVEMERVVGALQWVLREMDNRYHKLAQMGARNISEYNAKMEARGERKLPRLVVFIDELADLMMLAPDETERSVTRLAQLSRATGIHLVIATQRPSVDVVTGIIKANFPARIAFAVASMMDSRVILDQPGAERLLGRGDMLFQAPDAPAPLRIQGAFLSDIEIQRLVEYWRGFSGVIQPAPSTAGGVVDAVPAGIPLKQMPLWEGVEEENADPLLKECIDLARRQGRASITMLQRRLRIGYTRAARMIETMQEKGIISAESGPQGFEVLDYGDAAPPVEERGD